MSFRFSADLPTLGVPVLCHWEQHQKRYWFTTKVIDLTKLLFRFGFFGNLRFFKIFFIRKFLKLFPVFGGKLKLDKNQGVFSTFSSTKFSDQSLFFVQVERFRGFSRNNSVFLQDSSNSTSRNCFCR